MRTTIRIDDELFAEIKALAARSRRSFNSVVEDALRATLASASSYQPQPHVSLPTYDGRGLQPGIALDDNAALRELMDDWDAAR